MTIWICFGFRVAAILPLENGWHFFVVSKKAKFILSLHDCVRPKARRTEQQTCSRPHRWNHTDFRKNADIIVDMISNVCIHISYRQYNIYPTFPISLVFVNPSWSSKLPFIYLWPEMTGNKHPVACFSGIASLIKLRDWLAVFDPHYLARKQQCVLPGYK